MKRTMTWLFLVLIALILPVVAMAETAPTDPAAPMMYGWEYLATTTGATAAVLLIVQYTKELMDKIGRVPTRAYVYFLSLAILVAAKYFTGGLTFESIPLLAVNSVVVSTAAMGTYEVTFGKREGD